MVKYIVPVHKIVNVFDKYVKSIHYTGLLLHSYYILVCAHSQIDDGLMEVAGGWKIFDVIEETVVEILEQPLGSNYLKDVPRSRIDDGQPVDPILNQLNDPISHDLISLEYDMISEVCMNICC